MKSSVIIFVLLSVLSYTQTQYNHSIWGGAGVGVGYMKSSNSNSCINLSASLNYKTGNNNFSISYLDSRELLSFDNPTEYVKSVELKYGRSIDFTIRGLLLPFPFLLIVDKDFNYSIIGKIGLSYNEGRERTTLFKDESFGNRYDSRIITGFGLPVEIELREEITSFLGMGLSFYLNSNRVKTLAGVNLNLYTGRF
ncbi:MAG TPA: hypothetical protein PK397_07315 [Ignavibacteriaceae bacterium]|jgi:hypothetical protein|nr:hypothetical protein [Ignavibacteriaceae bacterium]